MGAILDFSEARGRKGSGESRRGEACSTAEIVIFPGVRIERWAEDLRAAAHCDDDLTERPGPRS